MVQVEVVEQTCYAAQSQCQQKVIERRRRRREEGEEGGEQSGRRSCSTSGGTCGNWHGRYELRRDHCHLSTSEEILPTGPPPSGKSFYRDIQTTEGCQKKCDDSDQCVAFQVKEHVACWLYRFRP